MATILFRFLNFKYDLEVILVFLQGLYSFSLLAFTLAKLNIS